MPHLTEEKLIKYNFNLCERAEAEEIRQHLMDCDECARSLEKLKQKFSSLDLLSAETATPDDLIQRTIAAAMKPKTKVFTLRKYSWVGAAAAVLLVGLLLLAPPITKERPRPERFTKTSPDEPGKLKEDIPTEGAMLGDELKKSGDLKPSGPVAGKSPLSLKQVELGSAGIPIKSSIFEKPPFAPASAIELVTLPRIDDVQLTIYNSADLTLVRQKRNLTLKAGWNWLQFMWANTLIDPTSLTITPLADAGKIDVQQLVYPARLKDIGRWLIHSEITGSVPFEITYFTSGLSWRAFYMGTMSQDEKTINLTGYVRVANGSGEDYPDAQTRLIVGKVHLLDMIADLAKRQYPYDRPSELFGDRAGGIGGDLKFMKEEEVPMLGDALLEYDAGVSITNYFYMQPKEVRKEGLSEYFLYTIEGTETIPDKFAKRLPSFTAEDIPIESLYKYNEEKFGSGTIRFVSFANDSDHELGETPIPNGSVKIYRNLDEDKNLSYVGGTDIKYIPVDEEIELNLGPARLVEVKPLLMEIKTDNYMFDRKRNIVGWDEIKTWKVEITNTRKLPVEIEITRGFHSNYWTLDFDEAGVSYEKYDLSHGRFETSLEPETKKEFEYTITTYHGKRADKFSKKKDD
jgi:hypothetical protein